MRSRKPLRGFAVITVMVAGVVAVVLSLALLTSFGTTARAHKTRDDVRRTEAAAHGAVTKSAAWLDEILKADGDLDRALTNAGDCDPEKASAFVPPLTSTSRNFGGLAFAEHQVGSVKVWVRIVDNADDANEGGANDLAQCAEGEALARGKENRLKDDDGRVWLLVFAEAEPEGEAPPARRMLQAHYNRGVVTMRALPPTWAAVFDRPAIARRLLKSAQPSIGQ